MNQTDRIKTMEEYLDSASAAVEKLEMALDEYESVQKQFKKLCDYYAGERWMKDFEADEAGRLPADLKRGVLSEDAVYDLIIDNHDLVVRMMKIAVKALEEGTV